jgi:hypothetical protein
MLPAAIPEPSSRGGNAAVAIQRNVLFTRVFAASGLLRG